MIREEIIKNAGTSNYAKEKKYENLANSGTNFKGSQIYNLAQNKSAQL